jgi:hypothetical protein
MLLPYKFKTIGWVLLIPGWLLAILSLFDKNLIFLNAKILAIYSYYLSTKTFVWITNNFQDEIATTLLSLGFLFIITAKEKNYNAHLRDIKLKSFAIALLVNSLLIVLLSWTVFGLAYLKVLPFHLFSFQIIFLLVHTFLRIGKKLSDYSSQK